MAAKPRAKSQRDPESILRDTVPPEFRQERARRSYLALIEAATELFEARGYDATGTPEIAQRAGVSVGTFYRYFEDKQEIYLEVARRMLMTAYRATLAGLGPANFVGKARHETIVATVDLLFDHVLTRPELSRSITEMSLRDPAVAELRRAFETMSVRRLTELITAVTDRAFVPDPEAIAYVLYGTAMQTAYGLAEHVGPPPVDAKRAKAALTSFIERALFAS